MGLIHHPISKEEIGEQIAALLNTHSDLSFRRNFSDILSGKVDYIVETHGRHVLAACGKERLNFQLTEVKHLVVRPDWRGKGLGQFMTKKIVQSIDTPLIYATVKRDNTPSLSIFKVEGFQESSVYFNENHDVVMLVRSNPKWTPKPDWKSVSSDATNKDRGAELSTPT